MPRGTLEIAVYEPPAQPDAMRTDSAVIEHFIPPSRRRCASRYIVATTGAIASLLLHALLITSFTWGGGGRAQAHSLRPADLRAPGSSAKETDELTMELVSVAEQPGANSEPDKEMLASATLVSVSVAAALANVKVSTQANLNEADAAAQAALAGRYLGQINSRIERAWRRPRTPVKEGLFSCRVRIEQDPRGEVKNITLEHCNGDTRWQVSLVHAIQLASPLPAPPDPGVFTPVLRMDFRAEPYSAQVQQDAYEPTSTGSW